MPATSFESTAKVATRPAAAARTHPVWDLFVRIFHWSLVAAVSVALVTGLALPRDWIDLHLIGGTLAIVLVAARVVWGFLGPAYARFAGFVRGPREVLGHLRDLRAGHAHRHRGHNPLGAAMIVALLVTVAGLGLTGLVVLGGALKSGPLAFVTSYATGAAFGEIHELLANLLIGLIVLHVVGAIYESLRTRENLVAAMVDGRKAARPADVVPAPARARAALAGVIVAALLAGSAAAVFALAKRPALGIPTAALDASYAAACGECHVAYHPSLMPAAAWGSMIDGLARHFGENATLDEAQAAEIRDYLVANAAETADTLAANRLRRINPADPLRITATPFWRRAHADILEQAFTVKAVGGRGNCNACHRDAATGLFHPSAIEIPEGVAR